MDSVFILMALGRTDATVRVDIRGQLLGVGALLHHVGGSQGLPQVSRLLPSAFAHRVTLSAHKLPLFIKAACDSHNVSQ